MMIPERYPELHPVPCGVEPDHILLGVVALPHHLELFHIKARFLELFDRAFGPGVGLVDSNDCVLVAHFIPLLVFASTGMLLGSRFIDPVSLAIVMSMQSGLIIPSQQ